MPVSAKLNAAFPVAPDVRIGHEELRAHLRDRSDALAELERDYEARLELRALNCATGKSIDRFDTFANVRARFDGTACFAEQDADLARWIGMRRVGVLLTQPPLRPLSPLGAPRAIPRGDLPDTAAAFNAAKAGVALLRGTRGELSVIEVPSGKIINRLQTIADVSVRVRLSPNGRVVALPIGSRAVTFVDAQTGARLWETTDIGTLHEWLPELDAAIAGSATDNALVLLDLRAGKLQPHPTGLRGQSWSLALGAAPVHTLIGSAAEISVVEHTRGVDGVQASVIRQHRLSRGTSVTSDTPTPMLDHRLVVFPSMRDIGWFNVETGEDGVWAIQPHLSNRFAKLDETQLMTDGHHEDRSSTAPFIFDVESETLAAVRPEDAPSGLLIGLTGRSGFIRRGSQLWLGDNVSAVGAPRPLADYLAEANLQLQLARVQEQSRTAELMDMRARQGESLRVGAMPQGAPAPPAAMLTDLPPTAEVHAVGVYEGSRATGQQVDGRALKEVSVRLRVSNRPIVLVLSSYEPVRWNVVPGGARIAAILVSGYHPSTVVGAGSARILRVGSTYAYKLDSTEYSRLRGVVSRYVAGPIRSFQGAYSGTEFSVGP